MKRFFKATRTKTLAVTLLASVALGQGLSASDGKSLNGEPAREEPGTAALVNPVGSMSNLLMVGLGIAGILSMRLFGGNQESDEG